MSYRMTRSELERFAKSIGLHLSHYSPGDGKTRYKVFKTPTDYFAGNAIFFCYGQHDLELFLRGYAMCREHVRQLNAEEQAHEIGG